MSDKPKIGTIAWHDLTVPDAEPIKKFYEEVVGWNSEPFDMGGYNDFNMSIRDSEEPAAGICNARGTNKDFPPFWLIYINVENIDASVKRCLDLGGKLVVEIKEMGNSGKYCVIQDPAGAYSALFESKDQEKE